MTTTRENDTLDFDDLAPRQQSLTINGKAYSLRECDEDGRRQWQNAKYRASRLTDGKLTSIEGMADTDSLLVSLCLFEQVGNSGDNFRPVPLQNVRKWPPRVVKRLYEAAVQMSELDQEETAEQLREQIAKMQERLAKMEAREGAEKNGHSPGPATSPSAAS